MQALSMTIPYTWEIAAAAFYSYLNAGYTGLAGSTSLWNLQDSHDLQELQDLPVCGICRIHRICRIGRIFQFAGSDRAFEWEACVGRGRPERI